MNIFEIDFSKYDASDHDGMRQNLRRVGAMNDAPIEARVQALQQTVAELLTALEKAGIKTEV
jgi:hypothetical protein